MYLRTRLLQILLLASPLPGLSQDSVRVEQIASAEKIIGLSFDPVKRDSMQDALTDNLRLYRYLHQQNLPNDLPLGLWFDPELPGKHYNLQQDPIVWSIPANVNLPRNKNELAFYSILQLESLLRQKKISSVELTRFFIERLRKFGPSLHCVIELTEDIAMEQAKKADAEIAQGNYRTPLLGIPYGIKDLFAVKGSHTTWGTPPFQNQAIESTCFVAQQLEKAGAVLVAKLSLGELAMDDIWFGGLTRNPWNPKLGSGGSSAGSASATVAGLVPFAIGTETYGSIVDPSARCGASGLRPSFGAVSRTGAMALAWSSDKIGPLCRSAEDAAVVFAYIHGTDGIDRSARQIPFNYTGKVNLQKLRIAYAGNYMDTFPASGPEREVIAKLRSMGASVTRMEFPSRTYASELLSLIIGAESAAAFDELTRSRRDDEMVQQNKDRWPNTFRSARFIPAVEYINACRMRYSIMERMDSLFGPYDIVIAPPETGEQLALTNLTGYPSVTVPVGFNSEGMPLCISFISKLYDEARLLALVKAFQDATDFHLKHPPAFME
jgi:Asp-tRNA(Asn)/Glu-tRNA(Gln) amidotransferase A subunit family amidase